MHQVAEYLLGWRSSRQAVQSPTPLLPIVSAPPSSCSPRITDGPLAAFRPCPGRRTAWSTSSLAIVALARSPCCRGSTSTPATRAVLVIAVALLGLLIVRTSYAPKPVRAPAQPG